MAPEQPSTNASARGLALVACGGFAGALCRYRVEEALPHPSAALPTATLLVNLVGAFALGLLAECLSRPGGDTTATRRVRLLLATGFLGAFTTYSSLAVESDLLVRGGHADVAAAYVGLSVLGGLVAAGLGISAAVAARRRRLARAPGGPA